MAGHKGYGLALLIETLSGILSGAGVTWGIRSWMLADTSLPTGHGAAFLAIDPRRIAPEGKLLSRVDALIDEDSTKRRKAEGSERIHRAGRARWITTAKR